MSKDPKNCFRSSPVTNYLPSFILTILIICDHCSSLLIVHRWGSSCSIITRLFPASFPHAKRLNMSLQQIQRELQRLHQNCSERNLRTGHAFPAECGTLSQQRWPKTIQTSGTQCLNGFITDWPRMAMKSLKSIVSIVYRQEKANRVYKWYPWYLSSPMTTWSVAI